MTAFHVQQLLYDRFMSVGFRPTEEDLRVIEANRREGEKTSDVIRRALRLLAREAWEDGPALTCTGTKLAPSLNAASSRSPFHPAVPAERRRASPDGGQARTAGKPGRRARDVTTLDPARPVDHQLITVNDLNPAELWSTAKRMLDAGLSRPGLRNCQGLSGARSGAVVFLGVRQPRTCRCVQRTRRGGWRTPTRCRTSRGP